MEGRGRGRGLSRGNAPSKRAQANRNDPDTTVGKQPQQQQDHGGQGQQRASSSNKQSRSQPQQQKDHGGQGQQRASSSNKQSRSQPQQQQDEPAPSRQPVATGQARQISHRGGSGAGVVDSMSRIQISDRGDGGGRYMPIVTRPNHITNASKKGTAGKPVTVVTNYYRLVSQPDWVMYQYHVDYNPELDNIRVRKGMLHDHSDLLGPTKAFDGMILYLPKKLEKETVVYSQDRQNGNKVQITIKLTRELPVHSPQCLQLINIIFRKMLECMKLKMIGRNYFDTENTIAIPQHKLEVMPGYTTSILNYDGGVMLCADTSHRVLRSDTVLDIMYNLFNRDKRSFYDECTRQLVGQIVMTRHNNRTYLVDDIDWNKRVTDTFKGRDGDISYKDYFLKHYKLEIHDLEQPMLMSLPKAKDVKVGRKEDIYLPPELCVLTGLDEAARKNYNVMKDIGSHARQPPGPRVNTLNHLVNQLHKNVDARAELDRWKIKIAPQLTEIATRVLPPEAIYQCGKEIRYNAVEAEWSRGMKGYHLNTTVPLNDWLFLVPNRNKPSAQTLLDALVSVAGQMGFHIGAPTMIELMNDRTDTYLSSIRGRVTPTTQLVMVMFPSVRKDRYEAVKQVTCCEVPVPCQLVVARTIEKNTRSVAMKIAIQLNCKLGGDIWNVDIPLKSLMVVGIDVFHRRGKRSVGATVASLNNTCTRFFSKVVFHHENMELLDGLEINITASLRQYMAVNNTLPAWIVIYRDGVGDGQLQAVNEHEVPQILRTIAKVGGEEYNRKHYCHDYIYKVNSVGMLVRCHSHKHYCHDYNYKVNSVGMLVRCHSHKHYCHEYIRPNVFFVVVKKRINSRIMAKMPNGYANPPPGTVVDTEITKPEWFDFFLVSQVARQGTVSPTHFNVIYATPGLKADHMQRLAYKLTHLYYNWPGTVRVPAPCQYAHKLAALVGDALYKEPHMSLCDKLFFL